MSGSVYKRCRCGTTGTPGKRACKKPHGTWWWRAEATRDPETGKRRQPSQGGYRTQQDAEEGLNEYLAARNAGRLRDDRSITVGEWFDRWLAEGSWEALTRDTYETHVRSIWRKRIGQMRLRDLRKQHIEDVLREMTTRRAGPDRAPRTLRSYRATLRACLTAAVEAGYIAVNPATGTMRAIPATGRPELNMWQPAELRLFLAVSAGSRDALLWRVAAFTGLRRSELCGMRWVDVDLEGEHPGLVVRRPVVALAGEQPCTVCGGKHRGAVIKSAPKSDAGLRWVPLVAEAVAALRQQQQKIAELRAAWGDAYADHDLVFAREDGTPLSPSALTIRFRTLVEKVRHPADPDFRLPVIRPHDMRHGAASLMIAAGVPIETVSLILGHSSPSVTRRIYTHIMRGPAAAAVEAAAALVRDSDPRSAHSVHSGTPSTGAQEVTEPNNSRSEASDRAAALDDYCITNSVKYTS